LNMFSAFGLLGCVGSRCKELVEFIFHVPWGLKIKQNMSSANTRAFQARKCPLQQAFHILKQPTSFFNGFLGYWDEGRKMGTKFCRCFKQAVALGAGSSRSKGPSAPPWVADYSANTRLLGRYCTL
jgi:hypothetical protein